MIGQSIGLPVPMALLSVVSVVVTSATVVIYGKAIWDPIDLTSRMTGIGVGIALVILTLDTMCCNLAANLVGPAYDFSSLWPKGISYRAGGMITATIAIVMMPWKILATTDGYIFTWLVGYSALLGPVAGILMVDYFLIRGTRLDTRALFDERRRAVQLRARLEPGGAGGAGRRRAAEPARLPARRVSGRVPERAGVLQHPLYLCVVRRPRAGVPGLWQLDEARREPARAGGERLSASPDPARSSSFR